MTPKQQSAYSLLRQNPDLPADILAEKVGCSKRQAANYRSAFKEGTLGTPKPTNVRVVPDLPKATEVCEDCDARYDSVTDQCMTCCDHPIKMKAHGIEKPSKRLEVTDPIVVPVEILKPAEESTETATPSSRLTRLMVWGAFALGISMSVVANVAASWHGGNMARIAAATAPLAFMFAVEIIQRVRWPQGRIWLVARFGGAGLVAAVAAVSSYLHQLTLLQSFEHSSVIPYILPLAIDGLIVVSSAALIAMSKKGEG